MSERLLSNRDVFEAVIERVEELERVKRFSNRVMIERQTVAAHTAQVGILSIVVAKYINQEAGEVVVDPYKLASAALFHDFEEIDLGDILLPTKKNPMLKKAYDKMAFDLQTQIIKPLDEEIFFVNTLQDSVEYLLLKFADRLEGFYFSAKQVWLYGNYSFIPIVESYFSELRLISREYEKKTSQPHLHLFIGDFVHDKYDSITKLKNGLREVGWIESQNTP